MPDHHHVRACVDAALEAYELALPQFVERRVHEGGLLVRVGARAAVAGEMLQTADRAAVVKAAHGCRDEL